MVAHKLGRQRQVNVWAQEMAGVQGTRGKGLFWNLKIEDGREWWHTSLINHSAREEGGPLVSSRST